MNIVEEEVAKSSFSYKGQEFFNRKNAAKYVGMTGAGLDRRMRNIERKNNIKFPFVIFPTSIRDKGQEVYINGRILDILRQPVLIGREQEWLEKLKQAIREVEQQGE